MAFTKSTVSTTNISDLPNQPLISPTALKAAFDKYGADDKPFINNLIDELESVTPGSSGAENMGSAPISGVTGTTVHAQLSDLKAQNVNTMLLTGNQTAAGIKTFSSSPVVPVPTLDGQATNKEYVDDENANDVHLTGNQTIAGIKTFSDSPVVPTPTTNNQASNKGYIDGVAAGFVLGTISDNSLTNAMLGTDIKIGSLAALTTTEKSSAVGAINEVDSNASEAITALGGLKFRDTSGFLEYSTDGVVWNPMGTRYKGMVRGSFATTSDTYVTAHEHTGKIKIKSLAVIGVGTNATKARITIDDAVIESTTMGAVAGLLNGNLLSGVLPGLSGVSQADTTHTFDTIIDVECEYFKYEILNISATGTDTTTAYWAYQTLATS